jgi:SAM-dependent methyltransferase
VPGALLSGAELTASSVVANNAMNRQRGLMGVNSYRRELGVNPVDLMRDRLAAPTGDTAEAGWLDLCCGSGRALIEAAVLLRDAGPVRLVGVDLVDCFDPLPDTRGEKPGLELVCAPVETWTPAGAFDLVTCVHGLHYVGDKLAVLSRAASWLRDRGRLVADLDLGAVRLPDGRPAGRRLLSAIRDAGFEYDPRRRRVSCTGPRAPRWPYTYLGGDDRAGPNYTGQPAVHSYYRELPDGQDNPESG